MKFGRHAAMQPIHVGYRSIFPQLGEVRGCRPMQLWSEAIWCPDTVQSRLDEAVVAQVESAVRQSEEKNFADIKRLVSDLLVLLQTSARGPGSASDALKEVMFVRPLSLLVAFAGGEQNTIAS